MVLGGVGWFGGVLVGVGLFWVWCGGWCVGGGFIRAWCEVAPRGQFLRRKIDFVQTKSPDFMQITQNRGLLV